MPSIIDDNLFRDFFDDDFYMPYVPDTRWMDKKLYGSKASHEMKADVRETDKGYEVAVDLPGVKKEDVSVELKDGCLTITAKKNVDSGKKDKEGRYIRRERYSGEMSRSFYVGEDMKEEDIHASFSDGILTLQLPKLEDKKQIEEQKHLIRIA